MTPEMLNDFFLWTFRLALINSKKWHLLSDGSVILSTLLTYSHVNSVTKLTSFTKYQRLYFKRVENLQIRCDNDKAVEVVKFDISITIPVCRLVSEATMDIDADYNHLTEGNNDEDSFAEVLENSLVINMPTVSILESNKNFDLFEKTLNKVYPQIAMTLKSQRSAISEILMTTLETASR